MKKQWKHPGHIKHHWALNLIGLTIQKTKDDTAQFAFGGSASSVFNTTGRQIPASLDSKDPPQKTQQAQAKCR